MARVNFFKGAPLPAEDFAVLDQLCVTLYLVTLTIRKTLWKIIYGRYQLNLVKESYQW